MDVITIESAAFKELAEKIDAIEKYVTQTGKKDVDLDAMWVSGLAVCQYLSISERTLQRLRSNRTIAFSVIGGKTYYTLAEIKRTLTSRTIRRSEERLDGLISHHNNNLRKTLKK